MGVFDVAIRAAIADIDTLTYTGGLQVAVSHRAYVTQDAFGDGDPYAAAVTRYGIVKEIKQRMNSVDGVEVQNQTKLILIGNVAVTAHDQFTLPDGTTPPILEFNGVRDSAGGRYYTIVLFGQSPSPLRRGTM
jgi:hypothetical protein